MKNTDTKFLSRILWNKIHIKKITHQILSYLHPRDVNTFKYMLTSKCSPSFEYRHRHKWQEHLITCGTAFDKIWHFFMIKSPGEEKPTGYIHQHKEVQFVASIQPHHSWDSSSWNAAPSGCCDIDRCPCLSELQLLRGYPCFIRSSSTHAVAAALTTQWVYKT